MSGAYRVLVVDDEPGLVRALAINLRAHGWDVVTAHDGRSALAACAEAHPDVVLLDLGLPDMDGTEVVARLREWSTVPIVVLSARDRDGDKIRALDSGADDYVTKPFAFDELLARIEALSRRPRQLSARQLRIDDLELDLDSREVRRAGQKIDLTPKEYAVLEYLMRHPGRVLTRTLITEYAWDYHFDPQTNVVDVVMSRLRAKIDPDHKRIETVRGVGYVFRPHGHA